MHMYLPVMSSVARFTGSALCNRNIQVNAKSHFDALNIFNYICVEYYIGLGIENQIKMNFMTLLCEWFFIVINCTSNKSEKH